ncbi:MAG: CoA ester lyase [Pigmentiphaga sp.]|nr:CoA ester lyase [Pigmentiphaga sp.]
MKSLRKIRTALMVPAVNERLVSRAHERGAEAIVLDLEDGVSASKKREARDALSAAVPRLKGAGCVCMVRINTAPELMAEDIRAAAEAGADYIVVPKVETLHDLEQFDRLRAALEPLGDDTLRPSVIASVESPLGIVNAVEIARHGSVAGLVFGPEDYCATLGVPSRLAALDLPLQQLAMAAAAAGRACFGVPGPITDFKDISVFEALATRARAIGVSGCMVIHPNQVVAVRQAYSPSPEEVELAHKIVAASQSEAYQAQGVISVEGKMVDAPVVAQALETLEAHAAAPTPRAITPSSSASI